MPVTVNDLIRKRELLCSKVVKLQAIIISYNPETLGSAVHELHGATLHAYKVQAEELLHQTYTLCESEESFAAVHEGDFDTINSCIETLQVKVITAANLLKEKKSADIIPASKLERINFVRHWTV